MKKWHIAVAGLAGLLVLTALVGCGPKAATPAAGSSTTATSTAKPSTEPTQLVSTVTDAEIKTECTAVQKNVVTAIAAYDKANPSAPINTAGDWATAMKLLVPKYDKIQPFCPAGGKYSFKGGKPTCSIHGALAGN